MAGSVQDEKYLTPQELAQRWGYSIQTLANWRSNGGGPAYIQPTGAGGRVRYPLSEVKKYETLRGMTPRASRPGRGA